MQGASRYIRAFYGSRGNFRSDGRYSRQSSLQVCFTRDIPFMTDVVEGHILMLRYLRPATRNAHVLLLELMLSLVPQQLCREYGAINRQHQLTFAQRHHADHSDCSSHHV